MMPFSQHWRHKNKHLFILMLAVSSLKTQWKQIWKKKTSREPVPINLTCETESLIKLSHLLCSGAAKLHFPHWVALVRQYQESNITSSCRYTQHPAILLIKWKAFLSCCLLIPVRQHRQMAQLVNVKENWTMSNEGSSFNDSVELWYFIRDAEFFFFVCVCVMLEGFHNARMMAKVVRTKR